MAQAPCEASLRPDWLGVSFKSGTESHRQQVWELVQHHVGAVADDIDWDRSGASRFFDKCFRHEIGARFETSSINAERNAGLSVLNLSGMYWALSSVQAQMKLLNHIHSFKGRFHYTRLDAQVTTLNPSQSAEQICEDILERRLWVRGYQGWKQEGLRDLDGNVINGASACFGAALSNRKATSYNKAAEQLWPIPARRDEVRLRNAWAEEHTSAICEAIAGAASEDAAIDAYVNTTSAAIAQHMQYLDITGTPIPKPKNWARGKVAPKWWNETLEQKIEPIKLNRRPQNDCWGKLNNCTDQYGRTVFECIVDLLTTGRSEHPSQALYDVAQVLLSKVKTEDLLAAAESLPEDQRADFVNLMKACKDDAAEHLEFV